MSLDRIMTAVALALAGHTNPAELRDKVCGVLLNAVLGAPLPPLPESDANLAQEWVAQARRGTEDPIGSAYEQMLGLVIEGAGAELRAVRKRGAHRATGAYYTGEAVVKYMVRQAWSYAPEIRSVLDPACGSGAFLSAVESSQGHAVTRLVGVDLDPNALSICGSRVASAQLLHRDALLDDLEGGFDLCIGNPPYISVGLRGAGNQDPERLAHLRRRYTDSGQYKLNTYPLFIERGLQLLRPGGVLGYIIPDSFLTGRYFERLRRLLQTHTILEITLIRQDFWNHGLVGQSVILFVRKAPAPPDHRVAVRLCNSVAELQSTQVTSVPLAEVVWGTHSRFRLVPDESSRSFLRHVEALPGTKPFGTWLRAYSGLIGRDGQRSLLRSHNPEQTGPWGRLLRSGAEIDRYRLDWRGEEVCLDHARIKSGGHFPFFRNPKIFLRQTADSLRAVYDDQGYYCLNNIHLLVPRAADVNLRAILGLINSQLVNRLYHSLTMEAGRLYPQVDLDLFESIPVPTMSSEQSQRLDDLVNKRESAAHEEAARLERLIEDVVQGLFDPG